MATEAVAERVAPAPPAPPAFARPYRRSWLNVLFDAIDAAPVPAWAIYLAATVVTIVGSNAIGWLSGLAPVGSFAAIPSAWGFMTVAGFWFVHYLDRVAGSSFDAFRPLLDDDAPTLARLRFELTVIPSVPALALTVIAFAMTAGYYVSDPVGSTVVGLSPAAMVLRLLAEGSFTAVLLVLAYHSYRQLRRVSALHARARAVDLFRPGPLYAFSRLTAPTGGAFIAVMVIGFALNQQAFADPATVTLWLPWLVGLPLFGAFVFVAPLWGMHGRLAAEKSRLRDDAEQRLKRLMAEIDRDVDAGDLSRADGLNKSLSSVLQQRDVVGRLSTWPWSATTARGFGTAIMLPIVLFVVQRLLTQFV